MNNKELATDILRMVGGEENVINVVHCATRLRFSLRDIQKADVIALENLDGVITTMKASGQFQVVIGNRVADVYRQLCNISSQLNDDTPNQSGHQTQKTNAVSRLIDLISSIFTPLLGAMAAAGVLKGLLSIILSEGWMNKTETTYIILSAAADSLFYFLPILLAVTTARKFQGNIYVAASIAGALIYPTILELYTNDVETTFFGIPVMIMKYTSSVIPIILAIWVMCHLERLLNRLIHETVRSIVTPFLLLVIIVPLTLLTIGPIGIYTSEIAASFFVMIFSFNSILAGALIAAVWQILVIFGMHWAFTPVIINDITTIGRSTLKAATVPAVFAQAGAVLGVMLKTKNKKMKALAGSTFITALFGITEPAVYGVTLKLKKPFICAVIAAAVGGGIVGYSNSAAISTGIPSLITLPIFYGEGFVGLLIGISVSFVLAAILTYIVGFNDTPEDVANKDPLVVNPEDLKNTPETKQPAPLAEKISAPMSGKIMALSEVNDKVFSSGVVGQGLAIQPDSNQVFSPVNGVVAATFDSGHALQIISDNGAEILIHVGLDTVQLNGQFYTLHTAAGQQIKQGDLLIDFDRIAIEKAGYDTITPVIIANAEDYKNIEIPEQQKVCPGDLLLTLS